MPCAMHVALLVLTGCCLELCDKWCGCVLVRELCVCVCVCVFETRALPYVPLLVAVPIAS